MAESKNLGDEKKLNIVAEEINKFNKIIKGHERLLKAIGEL